MLVGLGDVVAVHQRVDRGVELAPLRRGQRRGERLDPGLADDDERVDQLLALDGDRDAPHPAVLGVLDPGRETLLDEGVDGPAHRGHGDAEGLGQLADLARLGASPSPPSSSSALHWVIERPDSSITRS